MTGRRLPALALASPSWPRRNPASPMRWSATARTVSAGDGHLHASTTSRRMRSDSRRASSMAIGRLASALFSALLRGWRSLHGKAALARPPVRRRRRSDLSRSASSPRASCLLRRMRQPRPMVRRLDQPGQPGRPGRLMARCSLPGPRPEEAAGAGRAASQPGCAPPLRQPLLDRRRACVSMARRPAVPSAALGLSGGSRPPTPWTRRSTRMDDRSGTTAPWWGRAHAGA